MKYSEFERDVEAMGYSLVHGIDELHVIKGDLDLVISVGFRSTYTINSNYEYFRNLESPEKENLFDLAWLLASTPPEERGVEKRYRLRLPFVKDSPEYLTVRKATGDLVISSSISLFDDYQGTFTESEITELKQTYNLDSFIVEEASEDVLDSSRFATNVFLSS